MGASDFRRIARDSLRGKWWVSIAVTLVAVIMGAGGVGSGGGRGGSSFRETSDTVRDSGLLSTPEGVTFTAVLAIFLGLITVTVLIIGLIRFVVGGAAELGLNLYCIRLVHRVEQKPFSTLFERFPIFGNALGLRFVMSFFIFLWSLLFLIPGIVAAYRYAMAPYLMAQYPEIGIMEAMDRSKELMMGHKADLFFLHLSFLGWLILSAVTLGIAGLWVGPYASTAEAAFYLHRTGQMPGYGQF